MNVFQKAKMVLGALLSVTRADHDPRTIYHGRLGPEPFRRRLRRSGPPTLPPKLTGERLRKVTASCDPANLLVQPRYRRAA